VELKDLCRCEGISYPPRWPMFYPRVAQLVRVPFGSILLRFSFLYAVQANNPKSILCHLRRAQDAECRFWFAQDHEQSGSLALLAFCNCIWESACKPLTRSGWRDFLRVSHGQIVLPDHQRSEQESCQNHKAFHTPPFSSTRRWASPCTLSQRRWTRPLHSFSEELRSLALVTVGAGSMYSRNLGKRTVALPVPTVRSLSLSHHEEVREQQALQQVASIQYVRRLARTRTNRAANNKDSDANSQRTTSFVSCGLLSTGPSSVAARSAALHPVGRRFLSGSRPGNPRSPRELLACPRPWASRYLQT